MKYPKPQEAIWTGQGKPSKGALTTGKEQAAYSLPAKAKTPSSLYRGQAQTRLENCIPVSTQGAESRSKTESQASEGG